LPAARSSAVRTMAALAEAGSFELLFALAALVAVPLGLFAALAPPLFRASAVSPRFGRPTRRCFAGRVSG
jgi:hypothetical protein